MEKFYNEILCKLETAIQDLEMYAPMKLTTSGRSKLTTYFSGEEERFMYDSVVNNLS
jgi:hypothetical protein